MHASSFIESLQCRDLEKGQDHKNLITSYPCPYNRDLFCRILAIDERDSVRTSLYRLAVRVCTM